MILNYKSNWVNEEGKKNPNEWIINQWMDYTINVLMRLIWLKFYPLIDYYN